ncbi:MAG TPA: Gfo/Idh/MocA family oxidoreductase [Mycobacteriales bacterium]|jgi:predicted dehydrogenase|nr:Gfo/Idh/MocA family oxidoreductase [Mycobacteriales bacterium]
MARPRQISQGLGVAVIGCGTIGRLRAQLCHRHPAIGHLVVCDTDEAKARALAADCQADDWASDAEQVVGRDTVDAVIVATTEDAHFGPAISAISAGKQVLVEKPLTVLPEEGEKLLSAAQEQGVALYTGFTQRFRPRYLALKEHVDRGHLGQVTSAKASIYLTQAVAEAVISRAPTTTPAINTLTYCLDLLLWCMPGRRPVSIYAQAGHGRFHETYGSPDSTWSVLTFDDGAVASLGVSWELPEFWPAYVATMEVELFGREGVISIKDDHRDILLASSKAVPSPYTPEVSMNVALLGSAMPGDWALGEYFGAMKDETHAFLESVGTHRQDPILATGQQGQDVLRVSRAIDESVRTGQIVALQWAA